MPPRHSNTLMVLFCAVLAAALINVFYNSPVRARIENKFFDIRTRLSPNFAGPNDVTVIEIDDDAIQNLEPGPAPAEGPKNLSLASLVAVTKAALAANPKVVAVLLPPQIFPYGDPAMTELSKLAEADRRVVLGVFDLTAMRRDPEGFPPAFRSVLPQLAKADLVRDFRRETMRDMRVGEDGELPFLPVAVAERLSPGAELSLEPFKNGGVTTIKLNYFSLGAIVKARADRVITDPAATAPLLKGRAALIGYTTYRPWTLKAHEATFVNSPWQVDGADLLDGIPVVDLHAEAIENIVKRMSLKSGSLTLNVAQTALLTILTLAIWRLGVGFASFLFIGGWSLILLLHAALFAFANLYVPLADSALSSSLAMIAGALWRLRLEGRLRATHEAKASSEAELARVQERFLNRFAVELSEINHKIKAALAPHAALKDAGGTTAKAYTRALVSSEELDDYLQGIHQFAAIRGRSDKQPRLTPVDLNEVTDRVLRQFESRAREQRIQTIVVADGQHRVTALADRLIVEQILYNLISNAIKYSPPDRTVTIRLISDAQTAQVRVIDEGPGIAKEFQERIFEKFYRVKDDQVYKLKGHGLGLYLSRYFAQEIGASLTVESEPGAGATFTLTMKLPNARLRRAGHDGGDNEPS